MNGLTRCVAAVCTLCSHYVKHFRLGTTCYIFFIHGFVRRNSILIRSNKMQQYAGIYLLQNYSTCFGCLSHPSSAVHQTVTAASGTGHSIRATTFCQRGLIRPLGHSVMYS